MKTLVAAMALTAVMVSAILSSAPTWHAQLHDETSHHHGASDKSSSSDHQCAATLFAKGMVESDVPFPGLPHCPQRIQEIQQTQMVHFYFQPDFTLLPGRAPPVC